jgi:hypothetical protein
MKRRLNDKVRPNWPLIIAAALLGLLLGVFWSLPVFLAAAFSAGIFW